jgi:hypothetical protein
MALLDHVDWYLDANTYGGVLPERLLAAVVKAEGLWCGLLLTLSSSGAPEIAFWDRVDDLERAGFVPISATKARAICDEVHCFLERLEEAEAARRERERAGD